MHNKHPGGRFPDLRNTPKPRWRDALIKLAAPATRIHRLKELRTAAVEELLSEMDCRGRT